MNGEGRRLQRHPSIAGAPGLAGGRGATTGDRQLDYRRRPDSRCRAVVHRRPRSSAGDRGSLAAGPAGQDRSGIEPGLHPPHSLSTGSLSGPHFAVGTGAGADSANRAAAARAAWMRRKGEGDVFQGISRFTAQARDRRQGLPDLLNYGFAEDDHTIVTKDGARLVAFECHGPDLNSASTAELDAHRGAREPRLRAAR